MTQKTSRKCFKTALKRLQEKAFPLLPNHIKNENKQPTSITSLLSRNNLFDIHRHCNSQPIRPKKPAQTVQKNKKRGFIEETQKQEAQERPMGTASCLKISKLAWGFSDGHSIYGSQETSCIKRKGFIMFLSYGTDRGSRSSRGSIGSNPFNPSNPW